MGAPADIQHIIIALYQDQNALQLISRILNLMTKSHTKLVLNSPPSAKSISWTCPRASTR